jgi:gluconolactonase
MTLTTRIAAAATAAVALFAAGGRAQVTADAPLGRPDAIVDLATSRGVELVHGTWRYSDARIVEVDHRAVGPDLKPSGPPTRAYDLVPHAGLAGFDDSDWLVIAPESLTDRRSAGRLAFNWYRLSLTVPERLGALDPTGTTLVFEVVVDDYAEIWVNGQLPVTLGQAGGQLVKGFNAPNRVVLTRDARPGQRFDIAVFGANGPLSNPPGNFIWVRSATLDVYAPATAARDSEGTISRLDPAVDAIVPANAVIERIATGFEFTEGPIWSPDGYLLFSDPNANAIYRWTPDGQVSVFRTKSGYAGLDIARYHQPGSNGLTFDAQGRLTIDEHGNRRVTRLEKNGVLTVLADRYQGRRLNSPNDLVYKSDGALYFTDPPFGLPRVYDDPGKELPYSGVFRVLDGDLRLLTDELEGPNGLAFSPDERVLYVGNWDPDRKVVMRYPVKTDGALEPGTVLVDLTNEAGDEAIDGVKVDVRGNVYVSGPGGLWIVSAEGRKLGLIRPTEQPANFAWGDADGRTLYMTARTGVYRIRLNVAGVRPEPAPTGR